MIRVLLHFLVLLVLHQVPDAKTAPVLANETDYQALLSFKGHITLDPFNALSSWNDSVHFCKWNGVTCGGKSNIEHLRVTAVELRSLKLVGPLSPQIGNLTFLQAMILSDNGFTGAIPQEIAKLSRLQILDLSNNSLGGQLPRNLTNCAKLWTISLRGNDLEGRIPDSLGTFWNLTRLGLSDNRLTGRIPPSLSNLSALTHLFLSGNHLEGSVPPELGQLFNLAYLQLSSNNLSGPMPTPLYNISSTVMFSVVVNNLSGYLPSDLFLRLPKLKGLYLGVNSFSGLLPTTIRNASQLVQIDISRNFFRGPIPEDLGGLENLQVLNFGGNPLGTKGGDDLRFLASLTNCSNLLLLWLQMNNLVGTLPDSIGNLSGTFASLMLDQNLITGTIPRGIGSLVNLELLSLHSNKFVGSIPDSIGKLSKLKTLFVDQNNLRGRIPPSIGNMTSLIDLTLGDNMLEGTVPASIGNCTLLKGVHLSGNFLVGTLPEELFCLSSLSTGLLLASNHFTGPLPTQVGDLRNLGALDISENDMTAELPSTLGSCLMLQLLNLRGNQFNGTIPSSLKNLRSLQSLDLSRNNLSGQIPGYLGELPFMEYLNLSFNMFQGEVPSGRIFGNLSAVSVVGNTELCGGPLTLHLPECKSPQDNKRKRTRRVVVPICAAISIVLVFSGIFTIVRLRRSKGAILTVSGSLQLKFYPKFTYMELFQATDGFSPSNMIGEGSFGVVYKGVLPRSKEIVAVKVLKPGEWGANKSFMAECEALTNIRHRNLVKTITCCSTIDSRGNDFKALVFEYMPNGSLDRWLHPIPLDIAGTDNSTTLSILQRLSIAIDVAEALHYLHDQCQMPIVHCDLKPSNVLLDSDFSAHLGDFGLSKFLMLGESVTVSSSTGIRGTVGYVAPEYGTGGKASTLGDVYSFGILLLELFTGKRPTEPIFEGSFSIREFVEQSLLPNRLAYAMDPTLGLEEVGGNLCDCLLSVHQVGLLCSAASPNDRLDIGEALTELHKARDRLNRTIKYS